MAAPRRRVARAPKRRSLLVFAEGEVTEEAYLLDWQRRFRGRVSVELHDFHGTPMSLVQKAVEVKAGNERNERRRGRAHDQVWCIFDVDQHPQLHEAIALARANGIELAISNPCIELWFLLHLAEQSAYIERRDAQRQAAASLGAGKGLSEAALAMLSENFETAKGRAQRLEQKHRGDGTPAPANPSSGAWRLIDSIRESEAPGA